MKPGIKELLFPAQIFVEFYIRDACLQLDEPVSFVHSTLTVTQWHSSYYYSSTLEFKQNRYSSLAFSTANYNERYGTDTDTDCMRVW